MSLWMRRLWIQVTSDRRRMAALAGCVLLGLLLWARIIIVSNMPRTAVANEPPAGTTSGNAAGSGSGSSEASTKLPRADQAVVLDSSPAHDPFVISPQYFPRPTQTAVPVTEGDKSGAQPAEDSEQIEARHVAQLQAMLAPMRLEASMGETFAVISGRSYRRGDMIVGPWSEDVRFVLAEVKQRSVILEFEGRRFELKMASPGRE
jgi:hypothetical protein